MRTLALSAAISMIQIFDISYIKQTILPIILNSINDPSWGVRLILIKNFTMVYNNYLLINLKIYNFIYYS